MYCILIRDNISLQLSYASHNSSISVLRDSNDVTA